MHKSLMNAAGITLCGVALLVPTSATAANHFDPPQAKSENIENDSGFNPNYNGLSNYEHDPDLALAMRYDLEQNGGNQDVASQAVAEQFYLAYLAHATDSFQRARVYTQLGVLFSTNWRAEKGEHPDYAKAEQYFAKALKEEPVRVGRATLRARTSSITPRMSREERVRRHIEVCRWLISNRDEKHLREVWLMPQGARGPTQGEIKSMSGLIADVEDAEIHNMVYEALGTSDPKGFLELIVRELPGSPAEQVAREKMKELNFHQK